MMVVNMNFKVKFKRLFLLNGMMIFNLSIYILGHVTQSNESLDLFLVLMTYFSFCFVTYKALCSYIFNAFNYCLFLSLKVVLKIKRALFSLVETSDIINRLYKRLLCYCKTTIHAELALAETR